MKVKNKFYTTFLALIFSACVLLPQFGFAHPTLPANRTQLLEEMGENVTTLMDSADAAMAFKQKYKKDTSQW